MCRCKRSKGDVRRLFVFVPQKIKRASRFGRKKGSCTKTSCPNPFDCYIAYAVALIMRL